LGGGRGRHISTADKKEAISLIQEAKRNGARLSKACEIMEISTRTYQRWLKNMEDKRKTRDYTPPNKLTDEERKKILEICNSKEFQGMPPSQIVPILAERGIYSIRKDFLPCFKRSWSTCS